MNEISSYPVTGRQFKGKFRYFWPVGWLVDSSFSLARCEWFIAYERLSKLTRFNKDAQKSAAGEYWNVSRGLKG